MRLFKRQSSDTCPQLVSATPISQEEEVSSTTDAEAMSMQNEESTVVKDNKNTLRVATRDNDNGESEKSTMSQSFLMTRKGISTWGRKVGRRWDQLKRSESSELLSVSGRRRRWSPNRKRSGGTSEEKENGSNEYAFSELPKQKRVSRVESLKNLFRSTERSNFLSNNGSSRNVTIQEEGHYPMEKALSEGAIKNFSFHMQSEDDKQDNRGALLQEKQRQLSRSIHNLQEQERVINFILMNQQVLKTEEGAALAKETLDKIDKSNSFSNKDEGDISSSQTKNGEPLTRVREFQLGAIKRNLFNGVTGNSECNSVHKCPLTGLEDLMSNLRLTCDESGYDSDSTRAGADSPDSEKCTPAMLKPRSFSITSDDYHGIDLSLPPITVATEPQGIQGTTEESSKDVNTSCGDVNKTITEGRRNSMNESIATETTLVISEGDETDSCDEETFEEYSNNEYPKSKMNYTLLERYGNEERIATHVASGTTTTEKYKATSTTLNNCSNSNSVNSNTIKSSKTRVQTVQGSSTRTPFSHIEPKVESSYARSRKHANISVSVMCLLDNATSPCKDSPPATKIPVGSAKSNNIQYYSPKRSCSVADLEILEKLTARNNKIKKTVGTNNAAPRSTPLNTPITKTLVRRELKTMKLSVEKVGNLGISVERREAVRPFYVISKIDANGDAAKSKLLRIGDEIVRVCGRRLRGMTIAEARSALRSCVGSVELQIAREPMFAFGEEIGDTWGDIPARVRSDDEVWTLQQTKTETASSSNSSITGDATGLANKTAEFSSPKGLKDIKDSTKGNERPKSNCIVVGETPKNDGDQKMTGMRKFQVIKKRSSHPVCYPRRATSLSKELLTVTLEKGATKKLGFSIVGGSDSKKGSMGIFVKDIMEGGQAAEEGTLRVGDEILAINGIPMDGATHTKALQTFKAAKPGKMILCIARRDPMNKRYINQSKSYDCLNKLTESGYE